MDGKPFPGPEEGSPYSGPLSRSPLPNGAGLTIPPGCCSVQLDAGTPYRPTALQGVCSECPCAQTERRQQAQGVLGMLEGGLLSVHACLLLHGVGLENPVRGAGTLLESFSKASSPGPPPASPALLPFAPQLTSDERSR